MSYIFQSMFTRLICRVDDRLTASLADDDHGELMSAGSYTKLKNSLVISRSPTGKRPIP